MTSVLVRGMGAVSPYGIGWRELVKKNSPASLHVPEDLPLKEGFRAVALRWLDASSLWFLNASRQAITEAEPESSEGTGVVVGHCWGSNPPVFALLEGAHKDGYSGMNPSLFPFSVGNAPAAQTGIHLGLKGPSITLNPKEAAGLASLVEASRLLDSGLMTSCVSGAVDHLHPTVERIVNLYSARNHPPLGEGAYVLYLEKGTEDTPALARVAGWISMTRPTEPHLYPEERGILLELAEGLLDRTGWDRESVELIALPGDTPKLEAESSSLHRDLFTRARRVDFQSRLGLCGASWGGAAILAAAEIHAGSGGRALLLGVSTGGGAYGVALEAHR